MNAERPGTGGKVNRRRVIEVAIAVAIVALPIVSYVAYKWHQGQPVRNSVIAIMSELRVGMPRAEVEAVLQRCGAAHLRRPREVRPDNDRLFYYGYVGVATSWHLDIGFRDGRLKWARVQNEDGPYHPPGVPPDIGSMEEPPAPDTDIQGAAEQGAEPGGRLR